MENKLTVKDIINFKGKRKLAEVYTHNALEAEACEKAGIEMIVSSENNNVSEIRKSASNTFLTVGLSYGKYLNEYEILKRAFLLFENGADAIYCPQSYRFIKAIADEGIPAQTIAPKFTGRFNKGVDYVGDLAQFEKEFNDDLAVIAFAIEKYGLPENLKLSVHSGSDKFSLYPIIRKALQRTGAGVHLKTAGTTWLEEMIGLSEAGGDGLLLAKEIYGYALENVDSLCEPYASVIDIDRSRLPSIETVNAWTGEQLANALRHIQGHPDFNDNVRQLIHISFKVAAQTGDRYLNLLKANEEIVGKNVTENIYERHLKPLFLR